MSKIETQEKELKGLRLKKKELEEEVEQLKYNLKVCVHLYTSYMSLQSAASLFWTP